MCHIYYLLIEDDLIIFLQIIL